MNKRRITTAVLTICILFGLTSSVLAAPDTPDNTYPGLYHWTERTIDSSASSVGTYASIAFDPSSGIPFVSYYDATAQTVKLASPATNANCGPNNTWWCRAINDPVTKVGKYSSLDISKHGLGLWDLGIAYLNENNNGLRFAEYSCTIISCDWTYENVYVNSTISIGYPSLKYGTDGVPHISFYSSSSLTSGLSYATRGTGSSNCAGTTTWQCVAIEGAFGSSFGKYNSLALNSTNQARISYYDAANKKLKYAAQTTGGSGDCGPSNSWSCRNIDQSTDDQGLFTSLALSSSGAENPHIAYYDKTSGMLKHAFYRGSGGNCGKNPSTSILEWDCDNMINIGANMGTASNVGISIALDMNKQPVIAYMNAAEDQAPASLQVARPNSASGALIGNCGPTHALFPEWTCNMLDGGGSYLNEADYASIGINSAGLAYVAYSEYDDYSSKYNLKVVYQQVNIYLPLVER